MGTVRRAWRVLLAGTLLLALSGPAAAQGAARTPHEVMASAVRLLRAGQYPSALTEFGEVARMAPGEPRPHLGMAMASYYLGAYRDAVASADRAVALGLRDEIQAIRIKGSAFRMLRETARAYEVLEAACRKYPWNRDLAMDLGQLLWEAERKAEAGKVYERALRSAEEKGDFGVLIALAQVRREEGRYQEAVALHENAVRMAPSSPKVYVAYARGLSLMRDKRGACLMMEKAAALAPGRRDVALALGVAYADAGEMEKARAVAADLERDQPGMAADLRAVIEDSERAAAPTPVPAPPALQ